MIKERRQYKRREIEIPLAGQLLRKDRKVKLTQEIPILSKDISLGGLKLNWPKKWKCKKCTNCLGWVFNFGCRFKEDKREKIDRLLDQEVIIRIVVRVRGDKSQEILARIIWIKKPQQKQQDHYDAGLNFIKVNKEIQKDIASLMKRS